jgi:hypothetical protein
MRPVRPLVSGRSRRPDPGWRALEVAVARELARLREVRVGCVAPEEQNE